MKKITSGSVNNRTLNKIIVILIVILSSVSSVSYGQSILTGLIRSDNGTIMPRATLKIKGSNQGASTDSSGVYTLKTTLKGNYLLLCSCVGYTSDSLLCVLGSDTVKVNFILKTNKNDLSGVNISIRRKVPVIKREYVLNDFDVATTAGAAADVAAALQTFPGASPAGNETGLFIHGGAANETQAFIDGMLVKNAFGSRLPDVANRSRFSTFLFNNANFSTNGYSAVYGQALSSTFVMETKDLPYKTSTEFSAISLGVGAAHTERFKNSSLVTGINYYNFGLNNTLVKQNINWQKDPEQYQAMVNYKFKTSATGMLKVFADYSDTRLSFDINNPISAGTDLFFDRNKNLYMNANYRDFIGEDWKVFAGLGYNYTMENGFVNTDAYYQEDKMWQQKFSLSRLFNNNMITFGAEQFQSMRREGYAGLKRHYTDVLSAGFTEAEIYLGPLLIIKAGLRAEYSSYLKKINLAPRTTFLFSPNVKSKFSAEYGIYYEKPDDSFLAQTADLDYERADNYAIDYEFTAHSRTFRVVAYYKNYKDLVKITTPVYSGFQAYGPPIYINDFNNNGKGYARGIDLFWRDQRTMPGGEYYVSYSFADTKRNYIDFPTMGRPAFAPEHTFNVVGRKFITKYRTQFSGTYTYSSGRTYFNPSNPVFMGDKTADFHNFSIGFSYLPGWIKEFTIINLTISNILGFKQIYGYRYAYDGNRREAVLPPSKRGVMLSFLINIGDGTFNH